MKKTISSIFSILILGYYGYFIITKWDEFWPVIEFKLSHFLILSMLIILTWCTNTFQAKLLLDAQGVKIGFFSNFLLICASACGNYLPFRLGTVFRMYYLKKHYNYNYKSFGYFLVFRFTILVFVTGIIGLLNIFYIYIAYSNFNIYLFLMMTGFFIVPVGGYVFQQSNLLKNLMEKMPIIQYENYINNFGFLVNDRILIAEISFFIFLQILLFGFRFYISMMFIQEKIPFVILFFMSPVAILTSLVTLTPGGIGMRESLLGMVSALTGYGFQTGMYMATIDRAILVFMTLVFGILAYLILNSKSQTNKRDFFDTNKLEN